MDLQGTSGSLPFQERTTTLLGDWEPVEHRTIFRHWQVEWKHGENIWDSFLFEFFLCSIGEWKICTM